MQDADDVIASLRPFGAAALRAPSTTWTAGSPVEPSPAERTRLLALLGPAPVPVDELVRQAGVAPAAVQLLLLELELADRLDRHAGGRVALR